MYRRYVPLILMLTAGAVTCIITMIREYSMLQMLLTVFSVLVIFYFLGSVMVWMLNFFESQNARYVREQGEVIEKEGEEKAEEKAD